MAEKKKAKPKKVEKDCCSVQDIDIIRTRINELYVIMEGMSARIYVIESKSNRAAQRLGI